MNYFCTGTEVPSTIRTIFDCQFVKISKHDYYDFMLPEAYCVRICGNGFLKQMVRLLVGALWSVARGQVSIEDLKRSLGPPKLNDRLGLVAPASGLYLKEIQY